MECFLVGGAVRDLLLEKSPCDFDLITPGDPTDLAQDWAKHCGGRWFWLDESRRQSRVVLRREDRQWFFDFAPYRAASLEADLSERDFTINAMAVALAPSSEDHESIYDPCHGREDLAKGILRTCSAESFQQDPLRVVRAARFASCLGLTMDAASADLAAESAPKLQAIAPERIKTELFTLVSCENPVTGLRILGRVGAIEVIFQANIDSVQCEQALARVEHLDRHLVEHSALAKQSLSEAVESGLTRQGLLRLAALLQKLISADQVPHLARSLAFSIATGIRLQSLLRLNAEQFGNDLLTRVAGTPRALALWASTLGRDARDALLWMHFRCSDHADIRHRLEEVWHAWDHLAEDNRILPLLDGHQVSEMLPEGKGREVGELLDALKQAEIEGRIENAEDARNFLKLQVQKEIDKD
ncbi:CCA tRNA nucleotidyltransferase [Geoalkalibacter subterraneus]|uniref:CCA tRNA nucleotidyltransferase n=1 Tax=Geoalkalibacter subterraneus TaxID=483547 RepID=UPI000694AD84|nr:CCA tRNA nucleotidyltransferase [Geoalkalibacter subterraneus]